MAPFQWRKNILDGLRHLRTCIRVHEDEAHNLLKKLLWFWEFEEYIYVNTI